MKLLQNLYNNPLLFLQVIVCILPYGLGHMGFMMCKSSMYRKLFQSICKALNKHSDSVIISGAAQLLPYLFFKDKFQGICKNKNLKVRQIPLTEPIASFLNFIFLKHFCSVTAGIPAASVFPFGGCVD